MDLQTIFNDFKNLSTSQQKVDFLYTLKSFNLSYYINYDTLINYWSNH